MILAAVLCISSNTTVALKYRDQNARMNQDMNTPRFLYSGKIMPAFFLSTFVDDAQYAFSFFDCHFKLSQ